MGKVFKLNQNGIVKILPLLLIVATVGIISFLLISSTAPFKNNFFAKLFTKPFSHASGNVTFTPAPITLTTLTTDEIPNPDRSEFLWTNAAVDPSNWLAPTGPLTSYQRWNWRELEASQDNYSAGFSLIQSELDKAASRKGRFYMGFEPNNPSGISAQIGWSEGGATVYSSLPDYMRTIYPNSGGPTNGKWTGIDGGFFYTPDWNNVFYLSRLHALLQAVSAHVFNGSGGVPLSQDPRFLGFDMTGYGDWSEWHECLSAGDCAVTTITTPNLNQIIDWNAQAFPNKPLFLPIANYNALLYAFGKYSNIGPRTEGIDQNDMLGGGTVLLNIDNQLIAQGKPTASSRWKTMPFVAEGAGYRNQGSHVSYTEPQTRQYHVSLVASCCYGFGNYATISSAEQNAWVKALKESGYRYLINSVSLPGTLTPGQPFSIATAWSNVNVAPTYDPWYVVYELKNSGGAVVWSSNSTVNLKTILGGGDPSSNQTINDTFNLPSTVPAGSYTLAVIVKDPTNYLKPMNLAIQGKQADGSYNLGTVSVASLGTVYAKYDFESGDLSQFCSGCVHQGMPTWGNSAVSVVNTPVRSGNHAVKLQVDGPATSVGSAGGQRAELNSNVVARPGDDKYYGLSIYVPRAPTDATGYNGGALIWQQGAGTAISLNVYKDSSNGNVPYFALTRQIEGPGGGILTDANGGQEWQVYNLGNVTYDQWVDITIHVRYSETPTGSSNEDGFVEIWRNNNQALTKSAMRTMGTALSDSTGYYVYQEYDLYRHPADGSSIWYLDDLAVGDSYAAVQPGNPQTSNGFPFVTGVTTNGEIRNDFGDFVGMKITTGTNPVTVTDLGRFFIPGNSGTHILKVVRTSDGVEVGSTNLTMTSGGADSTGFEYAPLSTPVQLSANTSYYIVSQEAAGGDQWYGNTSLPSLTTGNVASVNSGIYFNGTTWTPQGGAGTSYVPVSFKYQGSISTPTPSPTPSPTPTKTPSPSPTPTATPNVCQGADIDKNGKVDIFDYNILVTNFGKSGVGPSGGDIDGSGKVDIFDYNILVGNFGKTGC